jgi:nucleolar protein 15
MNKESSGKKPGDLVITKDDDGTAPSSVIYLGHLPTAFEEYELKSFLSQFGDVANVRLSRSKKTSNPRGYAFCEFADPQVAKIVAETMSGYFLMEKRLVCHVLPQSKVHARMFHGKQWKKIDWRGKHREQVNKPKSAETMKKITARLIGREKKKREKLKEMGIDYDFPGYEASSQSLTEEPKADKAPKKARKVSNSDEEQTAKKKKRQKVSVDEEDAEVKEKKVTTKTPKSSKKKKSSKSLETSSSTTKTPEPSSKSSKRTTAQTENKKKKKKSDKKRRESVA